MDRLEGKVVVVTGAGSGFGEAISRRFAAEGAELVLSDIDAENCAAVADSISAALPSGACLPVDGGPCIF